jgi:hypothetical protein
MYASSKFNQAVSYCYVAEPFVIKVSFSSSIYKVYQIKGLNIIHLKTVLQTCSKYNLSTASKVKIIDVI